MGYKYDFQDISILLTYGDFQSFKNDKSSNGKNYSFGIETLQRDFNLAFFYYYFNANSSSKLDDDGFVLSISRKISF